MNYQFPSFSHDFNEDASPVVPQNPPSGIEYMPIFPMEKVRCVLDVETQLIGVVLSREGVEPSPAVTLDVHGAIGLIQALRGAIKDLEMLPPLNRCSRT